MTNEHQLVLLPSGKRGTAPHGTTLLEAARALGVDIESICGGKKICGNCLISTEFGQFAKHGISAEHCGVSEADAAEREYAARHNLNLNEVRLSCAARVLGDVVANVPEQSLARKQSIRKAARDITVTVKPAVKLYYVDVEPSELGARGDWKRIKAALEHVHGLRNITLDPILLPILQRTLRECNWTLTVTVWNNREVIAVQPGYSERVYGLAVDVGSTTIAGHLCDLRTGEILGTHSVMNPQVRYGEDLMSRVSYGMMNDNGVDKMHRAVVKSLNTLAKEVAVNAAIDTTLIAETVLVGNTVMHHIMLNIDPIELGGAPFTLATEEALDMKARDFGLTAVGRGSMVHILPCIAGHVGADNTAVLLSEFSGETENVSLVVDIGTNAEILLGKGTEIYSASSPTGPAFEGAQIEHGQRAAVGAIERVRIDRETGKPNYKVIGDERWSNELDADETLSPTGICGSGIIEVIAEMYLSGILNPTGQFTASAMNNPCVRPRDKTAEYVLVPAEKAANGKDIVVTQQDVRAIQLAKGALYAGIRLLMDHMGIDQLDEVKLAGGFGSYIDPKYAMILGLIPDCDLNAVSAVGNAAGDGALIALLNTEERARIQEQTEQIHYVETAVEPAFQDHFVAAMAIPHATAPYPHLADILPVPAAEEQANTGRRRNRRRNR